MRKLCIALGVAALSCWVASADTVAPDRVFEARPVAGKITLQDQLTTKGVKQVRPTQFVGHKHVQYGGGTSGGVGIAVDDLVYDNTTTATGYATSDVVGAVIGDDVRMLGSGLLKELAFSIYNAEDNTATLETVDIEVRILDLDEVELIALDLGTFDLTDSGAEPGLEPGYSVGYTVSGLEDAEFTMPARAIVALVFSSPVPSAGIVELGQSMYDPPTVGSSVDGFYLDNGVDEPGFYWFNGDPVANFFLAAVVDIDSTVAYSNTTNDTGYATADPPGTYFGDDLSLVTGGTVDAVSFSIVHFSGTAPITELKADIQFARPDDPIGQLIGPVVTRTLSFGTEGLPANYGATFTIQDLRSLGIVLNQQRVVLKVKLYDRVGGSAASEVGPFIMGEPTIGSSMDQFWYEVGGVGDWYWFGGTLPANFYFEVSIINPIEFGLPVTVMPQVYSGGNPADATFWVDPPPSGQNNLQQTPVVLEYSTAQTVDFVLDDGYAGYPAGTLGLPGHTFIKWFFRGGDTGYYQNFDTIASVLNTGSYDEMQIVFDTFLSVDATVDGVAATKFITITPNGLNGNYSGNTPRTNLRFDPIDPTDLTNNYYEWVTLEAPAAPAGQAITYLLTYQDGTTTVFTPAEATPGRVSLRVEAFKTAVAQYTTVPTVVCGDTNCDGVVDTADIDNFVYVVVNGVAAPGCPDSLEAADTNGDGVVDTADIDSFVVAVINGGCL